MAVECSEVFGQDNIPIHPKSTDKLFIATIENIRAVNGPIAFDETNKFPCCLA